MPPRLTIPAILAVALLLSACGSASTLPAPTKLPQTGAGTSIAPTTFTSVTLQPPPTAQFSSDAILNECPTFVSRDQFRANLVGSLAIADYQAGLNSGIPVAIFDLGGDRISRPRVPLAANGTSALSPNQNELAYETGPHDDGSYGLEIVDSEGAVLASHRYSPGDLWFVAWHASGRFLFAEPALLSGSTQYAYPLDAILKDPLDWTAEAMPATYPDIFNPRTPNPIAWEEYAPIEASFDPSWTHVVYPSIARPSLAEGGRLVLWDLVNHVEVVSVPGSAWFGSAPRWSPLGDSVAVDSPAPGQESPQGIWDLSYARDELFLLMRTGETKQLTHLMQSLEAVDVGPRSWSPDGRTIAFWMASTPDIDADIALTEAGATSRLGPFRLATVNIHTNQTISLCLPRAQSSVSPSGTSLLLQDRAPVWSPDGRQLAVEIQGTAQSTWVVVVDMTTGQALKVAENAGLIGWLRAGSGG